MTRSFLLRSTARQTSIYCNLTYHDTQQTGFVNVREQNYRERPFEPFPVKRKIIQAGYGNIPLLFRKLLLLSSLSSTLCLPSSHCSALFLVDVPDEAECSPGTHSDDSGEQDAHCLDAEDCGSRLCGAGALNVTEPADHQNGQRSSQSVADTAGQGEGAVDCALGSYSREA